MNRLFSCPRRGLLVAAALPVLLTIACGGRPAYCEQYDDWYEATTELENIERRNPSDDVTTWPVDDLDRWLDLAQRRTRAAGQLWDATPGSPSWSSVEQACR